LRSGIVACIGRSNAGKSTLINVLVGEKISITSIKPQTTRENILGILNGKDYQIVFIDTPGFYKSSDKMSAYMRKSADNSLAGADVVLFVADVHRGLFETEYDLIKKYQKDNKFILALTKIDICTEQRLAEELTKLSSLKLSCEIVPVSARKNKNVKELLAVIIKSLDEGEKIYPDNIVSDKSERFMAGEIIREKILQLYDKEIPHGIAVVINAFKKRDSGNLYDIDADIICEKPNHKAILIGKKGDALKNMLTFARKDLEKFLGSKVFLKAFVAVKEDWRNREELITSYGYKKN